MGAAEMMLVVARLRGIDEGRLAAEAGVPFGEISRWRKGEADVPIAKELRLARFLGFPVAPLLCRNTPIPMEG